MKRYAGITKKYIDRHPTASMTNNSPSGSHPVLSCKKQVIAVSKVCKVNNTIKYCCFLPSSNSTSITVGIQGHFPWFNRGMNPLSSINTPSWSHKYQLGQSLY